VKTHAKSLGKCEVTLLAEPARDSPGTTVKLTLLNETFDWLVTPDAF